MAGDAHISIAGVSVFFPLYHGNSRSLKKTVMAAASGRFGQDKQSRVVVQALRDISFTLASGDRLGLIGGNGAGKTTLLRTLAGIYEPVACPVPNWRTSKKMSPNLPASVTSSTCRCAPTHPG